MVFNGPYFLMKVFIKIRSALQNIRYFHTLSKRIYFGKRVHIDGNVTFGNRIALDDQVEVRNRTKYPSYIGDGTVINRNSCLRGFFTIGKDCAIAPNCTIVGFNHGFSDVNKRFKDQSITCKGGVTIEDNVWIGANCVILDGVVIGTGCVIGAGSVVTKSIPAYSIAFGNPCKVFKSRK